MSSIKSNMIEAGKIEILKYVPTAFLKQYSNQNGIDIEKIEIDEFVHLLAVSRYVQEIETNIVAKAISDVFSE